MYSFCEPQDHYTLQGAQCQKLSKQPYGFRGLASETLAATVESQALVSTWCLWSSRPDQSAHGSPVPTPVEVWGP